MRWAAGAYHLGTCVLAGECRTLAGRTGVIFPAPFRILSTHNVFCLRALSAFHSLCTHSWFTLAVVGSASSVLLFLYCISVAQLYPYAFRFSSRFFTTSHSINVTTVCCRRHCHDCCDRWTRREEGAGMEKVLSSMLGAVHLQAGSKVQVQTLEVSYD